MALPPSDLTLINQHRDKWVTDVAFDEGADVSLAASASRQTVVSYTVPRGMLGILRTFGLGVGSSLDWPNVRWALTVNQSPVTNFADIVGPISSILHPAIVLDLPLRSGDLVRVVATNLSAVLTVPVAAARLVGHVFARSVESR